MGSATPAILHPRVLGNAQALRSNGNQINGEVDQGHQQYRCVEQGWARVAIETGKGSGVAARGVGAGNVEFGMVALATALVARSKGANLVV
jgi:NitT/TauT family transport system substrate-binding protein